MWILSKAGFQFLLKYLSMGTVLTLTWACAPIMPSVQQPEQPEQQNTPQPSSKDLAWVAGQQWSRIQFPGKRVTDFSVVQLDGRNTVYARANSSASMLHQKLRIEPADLSQVTFSWKVPQLIEAADMAVREKEDTPVRIVLAFEGDRSKLSALYHMQSDLAQVLMGEPLPYATLMYVWSKKRAPGTVIVNPRTDRIRKMVVESGMANLNQWMNYERNIKADFERAFGEAPGALVGVALMTDSDNTQTRTQAWYGPVKLGSNMASTSGNTSRNTAVN